MLMRPLDLRALTHDDLGADGNPFIEIRDFRIDQAEAAGGHRAADGLRLVGAVDAINGVAEIQGARAHRIARPARHEAREIRLALDHLRRRRPIRPFLLARYLQQPLPLEAVAADADA